MLLVLQKKSIILAYQDKQQSLTETLPIPVYSSPKLLSTLRYFLWYLFTYFKVIFMHLFLNFQFFKELMWIANLHLMKVPGKRKQEKWRRENYQRNNKNFPKMKVMFLGLLRFTEYST